MSGPGTDDASARDTVRRVRRALAGHPRCDVHPDEGPPSCGWKRAVASVQWALDQDQPLDPADVENARLYRDLVAEREKHTGTAEMLEVVLQDAATMLGIADDDLLDTDVMDRLREEAKRPRTAHSPAELDALPKDTVVFTRDPRFVPGSALWIRAGDEEDTAWWRIGQDDTFTSEDVLYGDPREVHVLYVPAYELVNEENRDA